jgi:DNA processing protein
MLSLRKTLRESTFLYSRGMDDLYLLGNEDCLSMKRMAVVGTRRMSAYGQEMCELFTKALVENGWCVISGMARGVDRVAHETALRYGGRTVAVLGHGMNHCYPSEHQLLKDKILESEGLLVSAYEPDAPPSPEKFRERDVVMAKLAQAILVIESPRRSGVKITVNAAANEGKSVYVVPGPVTQTSYHGNVEIIRNGGIPVYNPQDLLEQLLYTDSI